jgi:transcriptional regulator of acetoin/glycerol metabolism
MHSVIDAAVARCRGSYIVLDNISFEPSEEAPIAQDVSHRQQIEVMERKKMRKALEMAKGIVSAAARFIKMPKSTFHRKKQKYGLK